VENTRWEGQGEVYCHVWSFEGGSPRLSRLKIDRLALDLWCPTNIVASWVTELDDTLSYLHDVY
jgi:hypothetical protein